MTGASGALTLNVLHSEPLSARCITCWDMAWHYYLLLFHQLFKKSHTICLLAADLWCCVYISCRSAPSRQRKDFLEKRLLICSAFIVTCHCDWHSCFRAMRPVVCFITPSNLYSTSTSPFCTLRRCTHKNQDSRCTWRLPKQSVRPRPITLHWSLGFRD